MFRLFPRSAAVFLLSFVPVLGATSAGVLYSTDFENFTAGADKWAGTDGWVANSVGTGSHGIDQDLLTGLGRTGFLGYVQPTTTTVAMAKSIPYNPATTGVPKIHFEILLGIEDSKNGHRDDFYVYFYNASSQALGAIGFLNSSSSGSISRYDGSVSTLTASYFACGEPYLLTGTIDLTANTWSAELDGVPIFSNATFNANGRSRVLGSLAFVWQLRGGSVANFGDNFLMVAEVTVKTSPEGTVPFKLNSYSRATNGNSTLTWTGQPGYDYQVWWSSDLQTWYSNLAGSSFLNRTTTSTLSFTDSTTGQTRRFYRVVRTESQ